MGFFSDLGNWVGRNNSHLIFVIELVFLFGVNLWILTIFGKQSLPGLVTTDDDHPAGVVFVVSYSTIVRWMIGLIIDFCRMYKRHHFSVSIDSFL